MATYMMVTGKTIRPTVLGSIRIRTGPSMKAIGSMISSTVKEKNTGPMARNTKVNTSSVKKMVMVNFSGPTDQAIAASSLTIIFMGKVLIPGLTAEFTTVTGSRIRCTAKAYLHGQMGASTRANTMMIRNRDTESFTGLMEDSMMDTGCPESRKAWASTLMRRARCATADGRMASASSGYRRKNTTLRCSNCRTKETTSCET